MELLKNKNIRVYSFDVFDTVVTRIAAHPQAVFLLIKEELQSLGELLPTRLLDGFYLIRLEAERTARKLSDTEDVTIEQIYDVIKKNFGLTSKCVECLISLEIEIETKTITTIPGAVKMISDLRNSGARIIFVSDMYLPSDALERILREKGVFEEGDALYVSGHMGLAKRTGSLFKEVLHLEELHPSQMFHLGDNRRSDYVKALKHGICSLHLAQGCLNRYEQILSASSQDKSSWLQWQLLAGASRLARLRSFGDTSKRLRDLHAIGANVAGPILFGFVCWLFEEAEKKGIPKLYFLARDGQVLFEIAQVLNRQKNNLFELKYLYSSRQAWHLPSVTEIGNREIAWITEKSHYISLRVLALRLGADPNSLCRLCVRSGLLVDDLDKHLDDEWLSFFAELLTSNSELIDLVLCNAERARSSTIAYLEQEGLFDGSNLGIVDSGLFGRSQDSLNALMSFEGWRGEIHGFYFGIADPLANLKNKYGYFFSPSHSKPFRRWGHGFVTLMELMSLTDHGATLAYGQYAGKWCPILAETFANEDRIDEICALRSGIIDFVRVESLPSAGYDFEEYREKTLKLVRDFYLYPTLEQAEALGDLQYTVVQSAQTERECRSFAPRLSIVDALRLIFKSTSKDRFNITYWIHGSRVRSGFIVRNFLASASCLFRFVNFLLDSFPSYKR
ncbi:MAG: hypothetical protein PHI97_27020 [Desulfobulbus sp.]|nr:hypothetical protein [Desulfobulbus sp.]